MPTPDGVQTVTLHARFVDPDADGTPKTGSVTFTPNPTVITLPEQNIIMGGTETATLDANGEFTIDLPCTDTPGQQPDGWVYTVTEKIIGMRPRTYSILLPFTVAVIELSDVTPTEVAPEYLPVVGPQGPPGVVTSVNGYSQAEINLTPTDVGAVDVAELGVALGVATLDINTKLTASQVPDLSGTYVTTAREGVADGVATLESTGLVPSSQLDLADTAPPAAASSSSVGVSTQLAREDHTHAAVDLTTDQDIAGDKAFANSIGVGVALASITSRLHIGLQADESGMLIENSSLGATEALYNARGAEGAALTFASSVSGDTVDRLGIRASGNLELGDGTSARDVVLYRSGVGVLNSSGQFASDTATPTDAAHLTRKDYVDGEISTLSAEAVKVTGAQTVAGAKTFEDLMSLKVPADTEARLELDPATGEFRIGDGTVTPQIILDRSPENQFRINASYLSKPSLADDPAYATLYGSDTFDRLRVHGDGSLHWGPGNAIRDVHLSRGGAGVLLVDGDLQADNLPADSTAWTPTWSTSSGANLPSFGNATLECFYYKIGRMVTAWFAVVFGSTTDFGGGTSADNWIFSLPVSAASSPIAAGFLEIGGSSLGSRMGARARIYNNTDFYVEISTGSVDATAPTGSTGLVDAVSPWTWADGHSIRGTFTYISAT